MKVDDLVQKINIRTDFKAIKRRDYIEIRTDYGDDLIEINNNAESIDDSGILYRYLDECGDGCRKLSSFYALLNLISEFVNTPVKERFPEKKYILKVTRYYTGPIPETHYITGFESCADYSKVKYGSKKEFTQTELENIERNDPSLKPFIEATKEIVEKAKEVKVNE